MSVLREDPGDLPLIIHMDEDGAFPSRLVYGEDVAGVTRRAVGAIVDVVVLAAVFSLVAGITLRIAGLAVSPASLAQIRTAPMLAFYIALALLYHAGLTHQAGQTLGKQIAGIRVVDDQGGEVSLARAVVRAAGWLLSVGSLGLLCLPAFFDVWARTVHDRLAGTHVVNVR